MPGLSRREFLGGTAGVAAAAALPLSRSTLSRSARAAVTPVTGATINLPAYGVNNYVQAANIFDGYVGLPLAVTLEKIYLTLSEFPAKPPVKISQLASAGCQFVVSVEPSATLTTAEQTRLSNFLAMLNKAGISYRVVLYSECNDAYNNTVFPTTQQWLAYWSYYAPVVKSAGVPCGYNPGCNYVPGAEAFFPSNPAPDELWMDFYATAFRSGQRLDPLIAMAQARGIPSGLIEFGWTAGRITFSPMTMPWWNDYCSYLAYLAGQKKLPLGAAYFGAVAKGGHEGVIGSASDPRIPGIKQVVNAVLAG